MWSPYKLGCYNKCVWTGRISRSRREGRGQILAKGIADELGDLLPPSSV